MDQPSFYSRNIFKIRFALFGTIIVFSILIFLLIILYYSNSPLLHLGGFLLLILTRIAFLILATPIAIIMFFIGHRIDDTKNKTTLYRYPMWVELLGVIIGIFFGWLTAVLVAFNLTVTQGLIWADPTLYLPFPFVTPLITYLCFKGIQFIYSFRVKKSQKGSFRLALIVLILSLPLLIYSGYVFFQILQEESYQADVTLTNFKEVPNGNSYIFTADINITQESLYHITASLGTSNHPTSVLALRLNGIANIDGLYNYELTKGVNKLIFTPNPADCPYSHTSAVSTYITFNINKVLADRFTIALPNQIKKNVTCGKL